MTSNNDVSDAVSTGAQAWEARRQENLHRYGEVVQQLNIVADAARLPRSSFFMYDHDGDEHLSHPLKSLSNDFEFSVYVHGNVHMRPPWWRYEEHFWARLQH